MAFQKVDKTIDQVLLGTHTDYINCWALVHDEGDLFVPVELRNPIMKKVTSLVSLKELLDKYKLPGVSMSYDVEFDDWGSWTASKSVDVYAYPENKGEGILRELWQKSKDSGRTTTVAPTPAPVAAEPVGSGKTITQPFHLVTEEWLQSLSALPDGEDTVFVETGEGNLFEYNRKVAYSL